MSEKIDSPLEIFSCEDTPLHLEFNLGKKKNLGGCFF